VIGKNYRKRQTNLLARSCYADTQEKQENKIGFLFILPEYLATPLNNQIHRKTRFEFLVEAPTTPSSIQGLVFLASLCKGYKLRRKVDRRYWYGLYTKILARLEGNLGKGSKSKKVDSSGCRVCPFPFSFLPSFDVTTRVFSVLFRGLLVEPVEAQIDATKNDQ